MDRSTTSVCLSLGYRPSISSARPRLLLWRTLPSNHSRHRHPTDSECATLSLAEYIGMVERWIGSIRRECLDHVLIFNECGLRRILKSYFEYYEKSRTHLGLAKDAPNSSPDSTALARESDCLTSGWRLAPSLRTSGRLRVLPSFHRTKTRIIANLCTHLKRTTNLVSARVHCPYLASA